MSHTKPPQAQSKQKVEAVKCTKPAQGQKNTSFELQSAPNLHRDTKNKSFELQSAPNLHRDKKKTSFELQSAPNLHRDTKKQKFWISKCTKPAQGQKNKKTKTSQSTWEGATIPLKFFFVFLSLCRFGALWSSKRVFFFPVQVWCTLKFKTCFFFVPVQVWCTLKFKTQCICSFVFWYCFYCLQIFLTRMAFFASHAAFWRVRCTFHAKGLQFEDRFDPFQKQILFSGNWCFFLWKSFAFRMHFLLVKGSLVEKLPSYGDLKMQRVQYSNSSSQVKVTVK